MKYPPHLHTIIIDLGPSAPPFQQHHADATKARKIFYSIRDKMSRNKGLIENLQLWHNNALVSSFTANPQVVWLPPPDENGVRHINEHGRKYTTVDASVLASWERYGKPKDMLGKVRKGQPKKLPSITPAEDWELII